MVLERKPIPAEDFEQFVALPENADRLFELIGGEIVEVVSNNYSSETGATILAEIRMFIKGKNLGRVTGADGGYIVAGERYIPDVAFISAARQPEPSHDAYNPNPPDLAVEVLSPSNDDSLMRIKVFNYGRARTTVWVVDPARKQVEVYAPDQAVRVLGLADILSGDSILPGFALSVKDIFPQ